MRRRISHLCLPILTWCLWMFVSAMPAWADGITDVLPATFVPITSETWLNDGAMVVIGAGRTSDNALYIADGTANKDYFFCTKWDSDDTDHLVVSDEQMVWTLEEVNGNFRIRNSRGYIARGSRESTLSSSADPAKALVFSIRQQADGTFLVHDVSIENRYLTFTNNIVGGKERYVIANYKYSEQENQHLRLYRYGQATLNITGQTTMPEDGVDVVLYSQGYVYDGSQVVDATDFLLSDASVADAIPAPRFSTEVRDAHTLLLYNADGLYVNADLQGVGEETAWTLRNGTLWQGDRVLRYHSASRRFVALTQEEAATSPGEDVALLPVAAPTEAVLQDGILCLTGGICASALAQTPWQGAYLLDLAAAQLPAYPRPFSARPTAANTIVLVSSVYARFVPQAWDFCVSKGDTYTLITDAVLTDRVPLILPSDIDLGTSHVTYTRSLFGDCGWETLVLPFDTDIPDGIKAETLVSVNSTEAIFGTAQSMTAGTAVLFQPTASEMKTVTFTSKGTVLTTTVSDSFCGVYQPYKPNDTDGFKPFFLHPDGTRFVPASAQNTLPPFRAFIRGNGTANIRLSHP